MSGNARRRFCAVPITIMLLLAAPVAYPSPPSVLSEFERVVYGQAIRADGIAPEIERQMLAKLGNDGEVSYSSMSEGYRPIDSSLHYFAYRFQLAILSGDIADANYWFSRLEIGRLTFLARARLSELKGAALTPFEKICEQRTYWEVFDALAATSLPALEARVEDTTSYKSLKKSLGDIRGYETRVSDTLDVISRLIYRLRLNAEDLVALGVEGVDEDPFRYLVDLPQALDGVWIKLSSTSRLTQHASVTGGRSYFDSYIHWPSSNRGEQVQAWLMRVNQGRQEGSATLPKPVDRTVFALVRQMLAIDENNRIRHIPIPEEFAFRTYVRDGGRGYDINRLYFLDIWASRRDGKVQYRQMQNNVPLWFGLFIGAPDPISASGRAQLTTVDRACGSCHNFAIPGPGDAISLFSGYKVDGADDESGQEMLTVNWKEKSMEGSLLQRMLVKVGQ